MQWRRSRPPVGRKKVINLAPTLGRTRKGISGEATIRGMDEMGVLAGGAPQKVLVGPNVRAKPQVPATAETAHGPGTGVLLRGALRGSAAWLTCALARPVYSRVACS